MIDEMAERQRFRKFTESLMLINVNELVNAELYNRVSLITSYSMKYLKANYTPQDMRAVLLKVCPDKYIDGRLVKGDCTAPYKQNRGISRTDAKSYWVGEVREFKFFFN